MVDLTFEVILKVPNVVPLALMLLLNLSQVLSQLTLNIFILFVDIFNIVNLIILESFPN